MRDKNSQLKQLVIDKLCFPVNSNIYELNPFGIKTDWNTIGGVDTSIPLDMDIKLTDKYNNYYDDVAAILRTPAVKH